MDKKLTLSLDASVITRAKGYAKANGTSLSRMIEQYLASVVENRSVGSPDYTPTVNRLLGVVELGAGREDPTADYADYLSEKYR